MTTKEISTPLRLAQLTALETDDGSWKIGGYATVFDNMNSHGFRIAPGAYAGLLKSGAAAPKMFFNHRTFSQVPIGKWTNLVEDSIGLRVEGVLTKGVALAADVYAAVKAGTLDGLSVSIGWRSENEAIDAEGVMSVLSVESLDEISVVTMPSDGKARITQVLSADEIDERIERIASVRDLEDFLRDTAKLSKRQSGWLVSKAKDCIASEKRGDPALEAQLNELQTTYSRILGKFEENHD